MTDETILPLTVNKRTDFIQRDSFRKSSKELHKVVLGLIESLDAARASASKCDGGHDNNPYRNPHMHGQLCNISTVSVWASSLPAPTISHLPSNPEYPTTTMAEDKQPPGVVEGATTGDVEDELQDDKAKSAEDRKAAAALSKLDARDDDVAGSASVDQEGLSKAMNKLSVSKTAASNDVKKVKVDAADVTLLVSLACARGRRRVASGLVVVCIVGTRHEHTFD